MTKKEVTIVFILIILMVLLISPFASQWPDGLERVAQEKAFSEKPPFLTFVSPIPEYAWPGIKNEGVATAIAGIFGISIVFALGYGLGILVELFKGR